LVRSDARRGTSAAQPRPTPPAVEEIEYPVVKRTFQPNQRHRAKKHGFRARMRTRSGRAVIKARRRKGRTRLAA